MAEIAPLKGVIYNREKIEDMSLVVAPPCGVVSPEELAYFHECHPYNAMNLDFGPVKPDDTHEFDWHYRTAIEYNSWLSQGVLIREKTPAIYLHETDYIYPETCEPRTRFGLICLLKLEEFEEDSKVKPHEHTYTSFCKERLSHLSHVQANLSQVFGVFPDPKAKVPGMFKECRKGEPLFDFSDQMGHTQRLWPVYDQKLIRELQKILKPKTVCIADGHHRYVSALEYRRLKHNNGIPLRPWSPLNYIMVYLSVASDPGIAILPSHRLLSKPLGLSREELENSLGEFFEIKVFPFKKSGEMGARKRFLSALEKEGRERTALGLYTGLADVYYLLKKWPRHRRSKALACWPKLLQTLDTVQLTSLVFQEVLGMTEDDLDDESILSYSHQAHSAIERVNSGQAEMAVLHNPTRIDQILKVAGSGNTMPRKSTFFYPKVLTGLVFNPLNPYEEVDMVE